MKTGKLTHTHMIFRVLKLACRDSRSFLHCCYNLYSSTVHDVTKYCNNSVCVCVFVFVGAGHEHEFVQFLPSDPGVYEPDSLLKHFSVFKLTCIVLSVTALIYSVAVKQNYSIFKFCWVTKPVSPGGYNKVLSNFTSCWNSPACKML